MKTNSAGFLNYRIKNSNIEVLLGKCGGPYWKNSRRSWNIPKGTQNANEILLETAKREFSEETGLQIPEIELYNIGSVSIQTKFVHIWVFRFDYGDDFKFSSNTCEIEFPKKSGNKIIVNEMDDLKYIEINKAKEIIFPYQIEFLNRLEDLLYNENK